VVDLGLAPQDFWELTFREYDTMVRRYNDRLFREIYLPHGLAWALHANINRDRKKHPAEITLRDYPPAKDFLGDVPAEHDPFGPAPSGRSLFERMKNLAQAMGGEVLVDRPVADN